MTADDDALLSCQQLRIGHAGRPVLPPIDVVVRRAEYWAVIGRNGSGKTTWLRTVLGLLPPVGGRVIHERVPLRLAYLPQLRHHDELHPVSVFDVVAMGLLNERLLRRTAEGEARVHEALRLLDVDDLSRRSFRELSEGQKQRVLFARVAASQADGAVMDEPTSAMDTIAERDACELLRRLQQETGMALIVVSHDLGLIGEYADHAALLDRDASRVLVGTPRDVFGSDTFRRRYGESVPPGAPERA